MNDQSFTAGNYYQNNYTKEQNSQIAVEFDSITKQMVQHLDAGLGYSSSEMQQAVQRHYDFCLKFWTPSKESYKSLAMSYILPTEYRDSYESYREGLGKYIYDAVCHFADSRLS